MNFLEIALIVIGIIVIAISCKIVDQNSNSKNQPIRPFVLEESLTEDDKQQLMSKINEMLSEISEEAVIRCDDAMSKLSNEKIIALSEYSDQIFEKINRNHEEVVFLYSMLNDKEKELKAAVKEIDYSKKKVQDIIDSKTTNDKSASVKSIKPEEQPKPMNTDTQADKAVMDNRKIDEITDNLVLSSLTSNSNNQILALYSQGKSIMEISKLLGLGQGEVKLVINLFKGKK
ncbi:MAG: DUF6115 domain-containing protein [Mobilitalea sp.]